MSTNPSLPTSNPLSRRTVLQTTLAATAAVALAPAAESQAKPDPRRTSPKRYDMKKSINPWAFPYP